MKAVNMMSRMTSTGDLLPFSQSTNIFLFFLFLRSCSFFCQFENSTARERLLINPTPSFSVFIFIRALDDPVTGK